jgi:cardiolipin synthase
MKSKPHIYPGDPRSITTHNKVKLVRGGAGYFECLAGMIRSAKETIHLQAYIFDDDETGQLVGDALIAAAKRNVAVYVLADGFASRRLSHHFINDLKNGGVKFRFFEPLFKSSHFYFGRRLHHKLVVTDTRYALMGGVNISDRYNDKPGHPAWLDFALFLEGESVKELCVLCWKTWNGYPQGMGITPCEQVQTVLTDYLKEECVVGMRRNDWVRRKNEISSTYVSMFLNAQSHITILCSYFLPGRVIRKQIAAAAKRGVKISVITAGVSDVSIAKYAERYMYRWLLKQGVEIYEYKPNVLHGKIAVCDDRWLTIGSYNINNLSAYASIELNMNVYNESFAQQTSQELMNIATRDCLHVTNEYHRKTTNIFRRLANWISYGFIQATFSLSTFYYRHKS